MEDDKLYNIVVEMVELYSREANRNYNEELTRNIYNLIKRID